MKQIVLFGAGKSSTALINYLLRYATAENWHLTVADANLAAIQEKTGGSEAATAVALDITLQGERAELIRKADIVISLLPPPCTSWWPKTVSVIKRTCLPLLM
jgi:saccharopine dehydrogenase-like NADP-dependent oxidoreductase